MNEPKIGHSLVYSRDKVYSIGGSTIGREKMDKLYVFDLEKNEWTELEPMDQKRSGCSSIIYSD